MENILIISNMLAILGLGYTIFMIGKYRSLYNSANRAREELEEDSEELNHRLEIALNQKFSNEKKIIELESELKHIKSSQATVEEAKKQAIESAKAAMFETSQKIAEKLIIDHKRETESAKTQTEKTVSNFHQQFEKVTNILANLNQQVDKSKKQSEMIERALLCPSGAGKLSEIALENLLKASGLTAGRDYMMQYSVASEDNRLLRPDAIIFLPTNNLLIVDSKASKFFMEAESSELTKAQAEKKLASTMRSHLRSLNTKDYKEAVSKDMAAKMCEIGAVTSVMFLPTDLAVDKLIKADPHIIHDAISNNIHICGPTGLLSILSMAKLNIDQQRSNKNFKTILEEISKLLDSIHVMHSHAKKIGNSIHAAANHYDRFAASFNHNFLSKASRITALGGKSNKGNKLSPKLNRYKIIDMESTPDEVLVIDSEEEADEV